MFIFSADCSGDRDLFKALVHQQGEIEELLLWTKEEIVMELKKPSVDSYTPNICAILNDMFFAIPENVT